MSSESSSPGDGKDRSEAVHEHVAKPAVGGGGHELVGSPDRPYSPHVRHFGRFRWAVVGLFLLAVCALAAAAILSSGGRRQTLGAAANGGAWSTWRPSYDGLAGAQEIADYVAPYYRATPAAQLAVVTVVNLNNPSAPIQVVLPGQTPGSAVALPAGGTIVYNLCGEGSTNCAIGVGTASANRLLLLRREALELALYTFRYITGAQNVVAFLPPGYTQGACTGACAKTHAKPAAKPIDLAVAFTRVELSPLLSQPLRTTLPEAIPPTVSQMAKAQEAELVSVVTSHGLYSETTAQGQDGSTVITLNGPLPPQ